MLAGRECTLADNNDYYLLNIYYEARPEAKHFMCESEVAQLCLTLRNLMDCSLPGSSIHGISQAIILEWLAISFSRRSSDLGIEPASLVLPALADGFLTTKPPEKALLATPNSFA